MKTKLHPVSISEFDNIWNKIALELAKPRLNLLLEVDKEKVRLLRKKLAQCKR